MIRAGAPLTLALLVPGVAAAGSDWEVPLEMRLYCDSALLGRAAGAFWDAATGV